MKRLFTVLFALSSLLLHDAYAAKEAVVVETNPVVVNTPIAAAPLPAPPSMEPKAQPLGPLSSLNSTEETNPAKLGELEILNQPLTKEGQVPLILQGAQNLENTQNPTDNSPIKLDIDGSDFTPDKPVIEPGIEIIKIIQYRDDQTLKFDSNSLIQLPQRVLTAIDHEVLLNFKIQMQLTETNNILGFEYQRTRKNIDYHVELFAHGFNRKYTLFNTRNAQFREFSQLEPALETLATLKAFDIAELNELHSQQTYTLRIRISLDKWKLPAPLLLEALFSDDWELDSGWYSVSLTAPQSWR